MEGASPLWYTVGRTFRFEESEVTGGGTTFVHNEEFRGVLFWVMEPWVMGRILATTYEGFNADLKRGVEGMREGVKV